MLVRKLTEEDLDALWTMRLRALTGNPEAFGSTHAETLARGKDVFRLRLTQGDDIFFIGAFDETLIGMVGFFREEGVKTRHKGYVVSMFVLPEKRGLGAGKALMQALIAQAKQIDGLEQLHLAVVTAQQAAHLLYRSLGFEVYGTEPRSLKMGQQYWDEDLMVLRLK